MRVWFKRQRMGREVKIISDSSVEVQSKESPKKDLRNISLSGARSIISKDLIGLLLFRLGTSITHWGQGLDLRLRRWDEALNLRQRKLIYPLLFALLATLILLPVAIRYFRGVPVRGSPALVVPLVPINPTLTPDTLMFNRLKRKYHEKQTK